MSERQTIQKEEILKALRSVRTHPTAEEVYEIVRKKIPTISLATVYRNLNKLYDDKIINRIEINKEYHYDGFTEEHQHFICVNCGKIIDLEIPRIRRAIERRATEKMKVMGLEPLRNEVIIYGLCKECRKESAKEKKPKKKKRE